MLFSKTRKTTSAPKTIIDKHERFKTVASRRTDKILTDLRLLGNCSTYNNYQYYDEEVDKIFTTIQKALDSTRAKFDKAKVKEKSKKFNL